MYFALLAFLYVGIEASVGNWMSTYATRTTAWTFAGSTLAVAVFWAALLLGRATTPAILAWCRNAVFIARQWLLPWPASYCCWRRTALAILAGSALTGVALAPIFPLILALFLAEIGGSRNAGWVFAVAGLGGAVLSWLTGIDFHRHWISAHRPDRARRRGSADAGDDQLA